MIEALTAMISKPGGRSNNEDACGYWVDARFGCWVVSDGAGGHQGGAIASKTAVHAVLQAFRAAPQCSAEALNHLLSTANAAVLSERESHPHAANMRATVAILVVDLEAQRALWAHAGDTRVYFLRNGRLIAYTRDHSLVQNLVDAGYLRQEQVREYPSRSTLITALGEEQHFAPSVLGNVLSTQARDAFLMCSDGMWEYVLDAQIEDDLASADSPHDWASRLEQAVVRHAPKDSDNYSILCVWLAAVPAARGLPDEEVTIIKV